MVSHIIMSESGHLQLDGDVIRYRSSAYGDWDLPLSEVRVIGEVTNQSGPFADDYFFCFATGPRIWLEASFYADNGNEFLQTLGAKLGSPLKIGLSNSAGFASRVLWPAHLAGEPMFRFDDIPTTGLLGKMFGPWQNRQTYTERIAAVLNENG